MDSSHQIGYLWSLGLQSDPMKLFRQLSYASFVIGTIALSIPTISAQAATPDEQAVLAPVNAMFDGMAKRDAAAIKEPLLPGGTMVLMRDGKPTQMTLKRLPIGSESREHRKSRSAFTIRSCESTTTWPWCGLRSSFS